VHLVPNSGLPTHDLFIGEVIETYVDEECLAGKVPDVAKVKPLLFDFSSRKYWRLGTPIADCWKVGKEFGIKGKFD